MDTSTHSVEVTGVSDAVLDTTAMNGSFIYEVRFQASVSVGALVKCKVENIQHVWNICGVCPGIVFSEIIVPKDVNDERIST
jgi:hypothetical protein